MLPTLQTQHELKTWPEYFEAIWMGVKTFEIRFDDREFKEGDVVFLREYDPNTKTYSGRTIVRRIVYVTSWNQKPQHVVMGLAP